MSRRRRPEKREILPDPKFGDIVLSKFMDPGLRFAIREGGRTVGAGVVANITK